MAKTHTFFLLKTLDKNICECVIYVVEQNVQISSNYVFHRPYFLRVKSRGNQRRIILPGFYLIRAPLYFRIFIAELQNIATFYDLKCGESMNNAERWNICAPSIDLGFNPGL